MAVVPGARSHAEGWAPLWAVPCVASRWRVRPVDECWPGRPVKLELCSPFLGLGAALGTSRGLKVLPVQLPFSRWVFCSLSLFVSFLGAHVTQFHGTEVQQKSLSFSARLPPPAPVPGVIVQRSTPSVLGFLFV